MKNLILAIIIAGPIALFQLNAAPKSSPGKPSRTNQGNYYLDYLKLKKKVLEENILRAEEVNFVPHDVVWVDGEGGKVVPRANPFRKAFVPANPASNDKGIVMLPNVDKAKEYQELAQVNTLIRNMTVH